MLVLHNMRTTLSNVRKKIKVQPNVRKLWSNVMLVLFNVTIEPSFARKKIELLNVTKVQLHVILVLQNLKMVSLNARKKYEYNQMWQKYCHM